jgi:quinol monooxygenase YgiN
VNDAERVGHAVAVFRRLASIRADYATLPVWEGFNWSECFASLERVRLYLVAFCSVRRKTANADKLTEYDDRAHREVGHEAGLLHYLKGETTDRRECLSFCLWESQQQALEPIRRPHHAAAAALASEMYESYELERYNVLIGEQESDALVFERLS